MLPFLGTWALTPPLPWTSGLGSQLPVGRGPQAPWGVAGRGGWLSPWTWAQGPSRGVGRALPSICEAGLLATTCLLADLGLHSVDGAQWSDMGQCGDGPAEAGGIPCTGARALPELCAGPTAPQDPGLSGPPGSWRLSQGELWGCRKFSLEKLEKHPVAEKEWESFCSGAALVVGCGAGAASRGSLRVHGPRS